MIKNIRNKIFEHMQSLQGKNVWGIGKIKKIEEIVVGIRAFTFMFLSDTGKQYVIKIYVDKEPSKTIFFEKEALKKRNKVGIRTPKIFKIGTQKIEKIRMAYMIMEFIQSSYQKTRYDKPMVLEMSKIIAKMGQIEGKGFGPIKMFKRGEFIGRYKTYEDIFKNDEYKLEEFKMILRGISQNVDYKTVEDAIDRAKIVILNNAQKLKSTVLHTDLNPNNIIFTKPISIIDPNPYLGHPYEEIILFLLNVYGDKDLKKKEKENLRKIGEKVYEKEIKCKIEQDIFSAYIIIRSVWRYVIRYKVLGETDISGTLQIINQAISFPLDFKKQILTY